jgi:hypothetical protein
LAEVIAYVIIANEIGYIVNHVKEKLLGKCELFSKKLLRIIEIGNHYDII